MKAQWQKKKKERKKEKKTKENSLTDCEQ